MSIKLSILILHIIFFVHVRTDTNNEQTAENIDTNEFGDFFASHIKKISDLKDRNEFKKQLRIRDKELERNLTGSNFFAHFSCFVAFVKHDLEWVFDYYKKNDLKHNTNVSLPSFFQTLNDTRDQWIYDGIFIPTTTAAADFVHSPITTSSKKGNQPKMPKLITYFQQWYSIISQRINKLSPYFLVALVEQLNTVYTKLYQEKNVTYDDFLKKFAGHVARSYILICQLYHGSYTVLNYGWSNSEKPFPEILFELIPSWYFDAEQFMFLQILHTVLTESTEGKLQYDKIVLRNTWTASPKETEGNWVLIPFYDARNCNPIDLNKYATSTPINPYTYNPNFI